MVTWEERLATGSNIPVLPASPPKPPCRGHVTARPAFPQHAERRDGVPAPGANQRERGGESLHATAGPPGPSPRRAVTQLLQVLLPDEPAAPARGAHLPLLPLHLPRHGQGCPLPEGGHQPTGAVGRRRWKTEGVRCLHVHAVLRETRLLQRAADADQLHPHDLPFPAPGPQEAPRALQHRCLLQFPQGRHRQLLAFPDE